MNNLTDTIMIGGIEYPLILNYDATVEINAKYGGIDKAGDMLISPENFGAGIDIVAELIVILTTQGIRYAKYFNPDGDQAKLKPLTVETIRLLCRPRELREHQKALMDTFTSGLSRNVISEDDEKNSPGE